MSVDGRVTLVFAAVLVSTGVMSESRALQCPDRPNCVSSRASNPKQQVAALHYEGNAAHAMQVLAAIIADMPRATVTSVTASTLQATFESRILGFVDDLDLEADGNGHIDIRSASRTGYYDFGVNRARVTRIRKLYEGRI